jgi:hypothetical protein
MEFMLKKDQPNKNTEYRRVSKRKMRLKNAFAFATISFFITLETQAMPFSRRRVELSYLSPIANGVHVASQHLPYPLRKRATTTKESPQVQPKETPTASFDDIQEKLKNTERWGPTVSTMRAATILHDINAIRFLESVGDKEGAKRLQTDLEFKVGLKPEFVGSDVRDEILRLFGEGLGHEVLMLEGDIRNALQRLLFAVPQEMI